MVGLAAEQTTTHFSKRRATCGITKGQRIIKINRQNHKHRSEPCVTKSDKKSNILNEEEQKQTAMAI